MNFEISEFYIQPYLNGVKLLRLTNDNYKKMSSSTISNVFKHSFNIYFTTKVNDIILLNDEQAYSFGFASVKELHGKNLEKFIERHSLTKLTHNNMDVMQKKSMKFYDEEAFGIDDNLTIRTLSLKIPWYNENNEIVGIFGCSFEIGKHSLATSIEKISHLGFLNSYIAYTNRICHQKNNAHLTMREQDCLHYTIQRKTSKEIAEILCISFRTVEKYIENIKQKMDVNSKQELIDSILSKN